MTVQAETTIDADNRARWRLSKTQIVVLLLVAGTYLVSYMNRQIFPLLLPDISVELNLSDTQIGSLTGIAYPALNAVACVAVVLLSHRIASSTLVKFALVLLVMMPLLTGFSHGFWPLFAALLGIGLAEATSSAPALSLLAARFEGSQRVFANSGYTIGLIGGMVVAYYVIGNIAAEFGWRSGFFAAACCSLIVGICVYLFLPRQKKQFEPSAVMPKKELAAMFRIRSFRWLLAGAGLMVVLSDSAFQWLPLFLTRSLGMEDSEITLLMGTNYITLGLLGIIVGGAIAIRMRRGSTRRMQLFSTTVGLLTLIGYVVMLASTGTLVSKIGVSAIILLGMAAYGSILSFVQDVTPKRLHTAAVATMFLIMTTGQGIGAFLIGLVSDSLAPALGGESLRAAMLIVVGTCGLLGLLCYVMAARHGNADAIAAGAQDEA